MLRRWRRWRRRRAMRCRVDEEWGGLFIGRRFCATHNVVWDDGGTCPLDGLKPGLPFKFARDLEGARW